MTTPPDPRAEARALILKGRKHPRCGDPGEFIQWCLSYILDLESALEAAMSREGQDQRCRELVQEIADSAICLSSRSPDYLDWAADITSKAREVLETKP